MSDAAARPMAVLQRAADVVRVLAEQGPLTPAELAASVGVPRASVYRLAEALARAGLVTTGEDGRFGAGARWLRLGDAARSAMTEWGSARAVLDDLAAATGLTAFLTVPAGDRVICVDEARGAAVSVLALRPGRSLPLHAGAEGRAALAHLADAEVHLRRAPFAAFTPATLVKADALRADVVATRRRGHSVSDEDVTPGVGAVGVPVLDAYGTLAGTLSLAGLADRVRPERDALAHRLRSAAARLVAGT